MPQLKTVSHFRLDVPVLQRELYFAQWQQLMQRVGVSAEKATILHNEIEQNYSAPSRFYHDFAHVHDVLETVASLEALATDYDAILLAAWFHDVIYVVGEGIDNEYESAEFAVEKLSELGVDRALIEKVRQLILHTRHDAAPDELDAQILLDADLRALAAPESLFWDNSAEIRLEYQSIPDALFFPGRARILQSFLERERIYLTDVMYAAHEAQARENVQKEIKSLLGRYSGNQ